MTRAHLVALVAVAAMVGAGALAVGSGSTTRLRAMQSVTSRPVVPLSVQRFIHSHAPRVAYVPTWLPRGWHYLKYENLSPSGFDLYFARRDSIPILGFDAVRTPTRASCNQGSGKRMLFRVGGVIVHYAGTHSDQQAWHCITHGRTHVLVTAHAAGGAVVRPFNLALMDATLRRAAG